MKKLLLIFFGLLISFVGYSQIKVKKEYVPVYFTKYVIVADSFGVDGQVRAGSIKFPDGSTLTSTSGIGGSYVPTSRTVNDKALTGNITLNASDIGLGNVPNETKAQLFTSPALTGVPTAPTAANSTATTQIATTAFVMNNISLAGGGTVSSVALSGGTTGLTVSGSPITTTGTITIAGTLAAANGGTGQTSYTVGDVLYASSTTALSRLAGVATGNALISGGLTTAPSWGKIGLTTHVSGTLPVANGGTGVTSSTGTGSVVLSASPTFTGTPIVPGYVPTTTQVNGHALSGNISVTAADVGLGNVTNESKLTLFASPAFTGAPTAPTAAVGTNTTQIATTAFVLANASAGTIDGTSGTNKAIYGVDVNTVAASTNIEMSADSIWLKNQDTGQLEFIGLTKTGALKVVRLPQYTQIAIRDTAASTSIETGYVVGIFSNLDGYNLHRVEAGYGDSQGTATPTITIYRNRGGTEVNMTSSGANFTTDATINTSNDDVVDGDRLEARMSLGSGTPPRGVKVLLTFIKP